ncbi:MAG: Ldh family oxidoreductase, partial [Candidatus Poribacteria bacterium]|nr:Ldh family oxidoreductase [Candidatus Poribacteria bacterium]
YDGDGGLGYFPCRDATLAAIDKAKEHGIAIVGTTNHGHFGAAGIYSRMTLEHDLLTWVTSGHQMGLGQGAPFVTAAGGSPMSYSTPTGDEDPFVLDFGAVHDLYVGESNREAISKLGPSTVFRSVGLGMICQSWGGFLQGVPFGKAPESRVWEGANQGSLLITFRIDLFMDPAEFKANMEAYSNAIHKLEPLVGFDAVYMAGQLEAERERANREAGVLIGDRHRQQMEKLADEFGLTVPW